MHNSINMKRIYRDRYRPVLFLIALLTACQLKSPQEQLLMVDANNFERDLQAKMITADSGAIIQMPSGRFEITRSLSLEGIRGITIRGGGKDSTVLNFAGQIQGAEGMLIKANDVTLEGFTIEDSKGDGIKILDARGVILRDLKVTWTQGADSSNGGYGIYPVSCKQVLMEHCEASYASDAGIYVGQCTDVIMRDNYAHHNVAGIEIENSINVDCYNNLSENNTGGILIFNLPNLPQATGYNVRVHKNICRENNFKNFSPKGGMVNILPPGSGITVVAHRDLEIFENQVIGHKTVGMGIISYLFTQRPFDTKNGFEPFYYRVNVYNNAFKRKMDGVTDQTTEFGQMITALFEGQPQDILIDGIFNPGIEDPAVCFKNNGTDLRFTNLNAAKAEGIEGMMQSMDHEEAAFDCSMPSLEITPL